VRGRDGPVPLAINLANGQAVEAAQRRQAAGTMLPGKKHIGRPRVTGPAELAALRQLVSDGTSVTQAARTLKISRSAAYALSAARGRSSDHRRSWHRIGFRSARRGCR
jgi:hypothetical protein